ncbi:MAG: gluconate:H+ symporter [Saprospiraceae bacterium]
MPILVVLAGVAALLFLIIYLRFNAFIALIIVALGVGIGMQMAPTAVIDSIQKGVGSTLGYLALILGLGAMLGALIAESGAAKLITERLIDVFGKKNIQWAVILAGFIVGVPMFYTVGFVMLVPIIFAVAASTRLPLLYVGIPMVAALSVTHGFLPPHPAPTAIAVIYQADIGLTLLYGLILAVPTIIIAGPIFARTLKNYDVKPRTDLFPPMETDVDKLPSFSVSVLTALIPVFLMGFAAIAKLQLAEESAAYQFFNFIGNPVIALLIAVLIATYTLGTRTGKTLKQVMDSLTTSVKAIAMIMLIIAGGGALKQVLIDSGISDYIVELFSNTNISPLILAWSIAAALRIALGSATVAALTAAGIALPLVGSTDVSPELLVLATGAGSLTLSQVNDTGFWLFKEYFGLSIKETFMSWTVMETIVSVVGLIGCLILDFFV